MAYEICKLKAFEIEDAGEDLEKGYITFDASSGGLCFWDGGTLSVLGDNRNVDANLVIDCDSIHIEPIKIIQEQIEWRPVLSRII